LLFSAPINGRGAHSGDTLVTSGGGNRFVRDARYDETCEATR
jgi:hypothetical protein